MISLKEVPNLISINHFSSIWDLNHPPLVRKEFGDLFSKPPLKSDLPNWMLCKITFSMLNITLKETLEMFNPPEADKFSYQMIRILNVLDILTSPSMLDLNPTLMI